METTLLPGTLQGVQAAARLLRAGKLVAFPTDTVYGLGALVAEPAAVEEIYVAKGRPESKGIPLLLAYPDELSSVTTSIDPLVQKLADRFWPGPLTLVVPKAHIVPDAVSASPTVAVRVPDHPLARALIVAAGMPLAVTSANRSNTPSTTDPAEVMSSLGGRIAAILDGGLAPGGVPSTILDCSGDRPRILRPGPISETALWSEIER